MFKARELKGTRKVLGSIDATAKRFYNQDGDFDFAVFELGDSVYKMLSDGSLYEKDDCNDVFVKVEPHWCKSGIYPEVSFDGIMIKLYILAMVLSDDSFYDTYMSNSSFVVNHTVSSGEYAYYNNKCFSKPLRDVAYNPKYLEIITNSENTKHGRFVSKYGLDKVYVSAKDVDSLEKFLIDPLDVDEGSRHEVVEHNIDAVVKYYEAKGINFKLRF